MEKQILRRQSEAYTSTFTDKVPELLKRVYLARDITDETELNRDLTGLASFKGLLHIEKAVERLWVALQKKEKIMVVGDFDADGATSTALLVHAMKAFGNDEIDYIVPNRFAYGYGLTPAIVDVAAEKKPGLIITVDNGISSHDGVLRATELGIDVLVTDHHLPADTLPNAQVIVNPNQPDDTFPSKNMAGVAVIFYVMLAFRSRLKKEKWFETKNIPMPNMADYLDLVALGTVSDVVVLDRNNRIMVHQGLIRMRANHTRPGIIALLQVANRSLHSLVAADLGFAIGPRLNAAGRLEDMATGISCLLAETDEEAMAIAAELNQLNSSRKNIEVGMQQDAFSIIDQIKLEGELPLGVCLYEQDWHQGIIGLVSSRVKERVNRPVIAFAKVEDDILKGSARSVVGFHIRDALDAVAKRHPDVLTKFGGHSMAAGLSIKASDYPIFKAEFEKVAQERLGQSDLRAKIFTDGELDEECFTLATAEMLQAAGPWGQGFPEPVFEGEFDILEQRVVGKSHLRMMLQVPGTEVFCDAISFNVDLDVWPNRRCDSVYIAYRLDVNEYRGMKKLQLVVEELQTAAHYHAVHSTEVTHAEQQAAYA